MRCFSLGRGSQLDAISQFWSPARPARRDASRDGYSRLTYQCTDGVLWQSNRKVCARRWIMRSIKLGRRIRKRYAYHCSYTFIIDESMDRLSGVSTTPHPWHGETLDWQSAVIAKAHRLRRRLRPPTVYIGRK